MIIRYFEKFSKLDVSMVPAPLAFTSFPTDPCYVQSFSFFIYRASKFNTQNLSRRNIILQLLVSDKNSYRN